jgi:general secretion pathway protein A
MKDFHSRYGFHSTPFTRELDIKQRFRLPFFDETLDALVHTMDLRMLGALIGPAGTGKTALMRALSDCLPDARYRVSYLKVGGLGKRDMCREIASAVGCEPAGTFPTLFRRVQERFRQCADTDGLRPVLLVDEAHELKPEVLGLFKVLTNFDMDSRLVVSVVFCGQARLRTLLRRDALEDIARRVAHYATLRPLSRAEAKAYIAHRCTIAGASTVPFDGPAHDALYEIARGNLRATDNLALKSIELAHLANADVADSNHVVEARKMLWP